MDEFGCFEDGIHWLIFIKSEERICQIQNKHEVYRITDILIEPFDDIEEVTLSKLLFAKTLVHLNLGS